MGIIGVTFTISADNQSKNLAQGESQREMYMGPGPVVSISESYASLPMQIKTFLTTYFPESTPSLIELKTLKEIYKIEMLNGYELVFSYSGQWLQVEAPDDSILPVSMVKALLPAPTYKYLAEKKRDNMVESIKYNSKRGFKVELKKQSSDDLYFNLLGEHIKKQPKDGDKRNKSRPSDK